jgi:hypothetical protein
MRAHPDPDPQHWLDDMKKESLGNIFLKGTRHRVGRVLSFLSSRRNWDSPTPLAAGECVSL